MVERANGNIRTGEYMAENMWNPRGYVLDIFDTSFHPDLGKRMCGITLRPPTSASTGAA